LVFNTTSNNMSVKSWRLVLLMEETEVPGESHRPVTSHWQTLSHSIVSSTPRLSGDRHWVQLKKDINTGLPKPCTRGRFTLHYRGTVNYKHVYLINNVRAEALTTGRTIPSVQCQSRSIDYWEDDTLGTMSEPKHWLQGGRYPRSMSWQSNFLISNILHIKNSSENLTQTVL
jgi:hypothetical protein